MGVVLCKQTVSAIPRGLAPSSQSVIGVKILLMKVDHLLVIVLVSG